MGREVVLEESLFGAGTSFVVMSASRRIWRIRGVVGVGVAGCVGIFWAVWCRRGVGVIVRVCVGVGVRVGGRVGSRFEGRDGGGYG